MSVPKPVLTFVVGVTGHRSARLKQEHRGRIALQLAEVLKNIQAECRIELDRRGDFYAEPVPHLHLVSSLADGADAMAIQQCPAGWTIVGLLPCPEDQYVENLRKTAPSERAQQAVAEYAVARGSVNQLVILPQSRSQIVSGLGRSRDLLVRQIDILIAVWDGGLPAHAGGTADVVDRAAQAGIPIIWIAADRSQRPWLIANVADANRETPMADATSGPIATIVQRELGVSERRAPQREPWRAESHGADAVSHLCDFLDEAVPARSEEAIRRRWEPFLSALPEQDGLGKRIREILLPRFAAADTLAKHYGRRYRSAYIWAYLLSVCAVAAALLSFMLFGRESHAAVPFGEACLAAIELFFVALIVAIVWRGQHKRWHDRWLDYRALAETLRHLRFLAPLGQYEKRSYLEAAARPGADWMLWYFRATMRELGMPSGDLGPDYQRKILSAIIPEELDSQIQYHVDNMKELRALHRRLHMLGDICFGLALVILILFLGMWGLSISGYASRVAPMLARIAPYVTSATAFLPALGAAFAGIRFTGDFEGSAERSAQTGAQLDLLRQRYELALDRLDFDTSASVVFESARIMAADINGWTSLYGRKHLTLPG